MTQDGYFACPPLRSPCRRANNVLLGLPTVQLLQYPKEKCKSMEITQITIGLAFLAGLASFLSPCVFSLVPAYIGYLSGRASGGESRSNRWMTFTHGLAFVLGFSLVFILLGVAASFAG